MIKKTVFFLMFFCTAILNTNAQSSGTTSVDSFLSITRNKTWIISKYSTDSNRVDKKSLFSNVTLRFDQKDSTRFLIQMPGKRDTTGSWLVQYNNTIRFSMPLVTINPSNNDSLYNEGVRLLCSWPLYKIQMQASVIKFKLVDPFKGEALVEFTRKE